MVPGITLFPKEFSVEGFVLIWKTQNLWLPFLNSLFVTTVGTFFQVLLSALVGYILTKKDLPFRNLILSFVLITMMIPSELTLVSIYSLNRDLGLLNTYSGLIVNGLMSGFGIILMKNYFEAIPQSLFEAAQIDYASEFKIFFKIYLPMSIPGLVTVGFVSFVSKWNSLLIPVTIITDQNKFTLPVVLRSLIFNSTANSGTTFIAPNAIMAGIVISVLPLIIAYIIAQRFLVSGMNLGSIKG
ncbi:carbohydrate ABC transporter permease [Sporolactobacillus shoreicorticis]|uniref:Carbohydrate ABC transporter permease n=1 Tax=Sporolactobacillus shoreicorticis TaxID=1923877 RepID=A0ABW5S401_9BACL|nr:carbohydrate ABC transporter permease [Sporolactobacillus shoreicorticis]MCO7124243.1 carbohydrate ABC transporter permease [Sporolactobacillus shoreicorticis]